VISQIHVNTDITTSFQEMDESLLCLCLRDVHTTAYSVTSQYLDLLGGPVLQRMLWMKGFDFKGEIMKKNEYERKKNREIAWYEKNLTENRSISTILHNPLFFNQERIAFSYLFPKEQMAETAKRHIRGKIDNLLIAPCGTGDDFKHLSNLAHTVYGIDLSLIAIKKCSNKMKVHVGDILFSGYPDETFELIASPLFFHHMLKVGFDPFLKEFYRILKKGGGIVILEPSLWYPLNIITRPIKKIFNNPYGEVEDEAPFPPGLMLDSLKRTGFTNIEMRAATFSHASFCVSLAKFVNFLARPLMNCWPLKHFSWLVIYWAEKGRNDANKVV
jgi:SAM-dependent methyltransferase